jgi:hypothetical protein
MDINEITEGLQERIEDGDKVNYIELHEGLDIVGKIASLVLGYLSVIILILVPIIITAEIVYICFPVVRGEVDKFLVRIEGKGVMHTTVGVCLRDAIEAVEESQLEGVGSRSALWIYLKLKCKSMLMLMFVIALIVQGSTTILNFIWEKFEGIIMALIHLFDTVLS